MKPARNVAIPELSDIANDWDALSVQRDVEISNGKDKSFDEILRPRIFDFVGRYKRPAVLDVGCGTGMLAEVLASVAKTVTGVDISSKSIEIARRRPTQANVTFSNVSLQSFARSCDRRFDVVVANMVLMNTPDISTFLDSIKLLLSASGGFIATITHPCFWPRYWGYENEPWFDYAEDMAIRTEFRTRASDTGILTTHIHRPLGRYLTEIRRAGLHIDNVSELPPSEDGQRFPRFLEVIASNSAGGMAE